MVDKLQSVFIHLNNKDMFFKGNGHSQGRELCQNCFSLNKEENLCPKAEHLFVIQ